MRILKEFQPLLYRLFFGKTTKVCQPILMYKHSKDKHAHDRKIHSLSEYKKIKG